MSLKLFSFLFVLLLASIACEGDSRSYLKHPKYRVLYYRNQDHGHLSNSNPVPVSIPTEEILVQNEEGVKDYENDEDDNTEDKNPGQEKGLSEDIHGICPGNGEIKNYPNDLRPILYSMRSQLRHLVRSHNQSEVTNKNILSVLEDTLAWAKNQATSFYSLISTFQNRYRFSPARFFS